MPQKEAKGTLFALTPNPLQAQRLTDLVKCDRDLPCANCRSRNRESFCSYDPGAPTSRENDALSKVSPSSQSSLNLARNDEPLSSLAATWGYGQTGPSTIGFLKKIETAPTPEEQDAMARLPSRDAPHHTFAVREKYKGLIRQLPAKIFVDKLVGIFMREFNWQYYFVDPDIFYTQLEEWNALPFSVFSSEGPQGISPDLRVFPAVLFHMIATAMLILPSEWEREFATLKYAANMTFEDLACDYSESGANLVGLFGKKSLCITTVQAEFLRASFLKFTANVTESWHMVAIAIRDAQELGMHRDSLDPKPTGTNLENVLENQWLIERRRKLYLILAIWDINMCLILGRPGTVDWRHGLPSLPIDAPAPSDRSKTPIVTRDPEKDPPTPLTRALWLQELTGPLRDIQDLEQDGPYPKDFTKVDKVQRQITLLNEHMPAIFRLEHGDTRWDDHPGVHWLPGTRYYFAMLHEFSLMALHRPYVFHRRESRAEALRAGLALLDISRLTFAGLPSASWRNFMLFFGAFDAIVLIASTYILFPHEHVEHINNSVKHVHWAIERFAAMQDRNPLAKAAECVLQAILAKFTKAVSGSSPSGDEYNSGTPSSATKGRSETMSNSSGGPANGSNVLLPNDSAAKRRETDSAWLSPNDWAVPPPPESLASIMPTFATSDLLFNDLTAIQDSHIGDVIVHNNSVAATTAPLDSDPVAWQFGGDNIGDGTLWQILNQFQPRG
ncbi:hypothetical protein QQS21_012202 [Conoideocrella luteorostrata]|uniref:Xylanolytic transcriptional activator regulatory domain-containing protein n=1 Tax=Conoideocrella luteorostrata TaxID=1105319 RepID=A0AAJ0CED7_9HYPO|nr:hypothetical protein QQS21_012202 [Conoideocrella luteorostrata]